MKTTPYLFAAAMAMLFASCSSEDSGGDSTPTNFTVPLADGKFWTYDITTSEAPDSRDSLYVAGDSLIGSTTYKRLEVRDNVATGFYSSSLRNNGVRQSDNKLLLTGDLSLGGDQLPIDLDVSLLDFVIFKSNATNGEILATKAGVIEQTFEGYPLTIRYTLKSKGGESLANFTSPNLDNYTDVKTSQILLNVSITTVQEVSGFPITITILPDQTILTSTQYLANGIGVVYTNTITSYNINQQVADQFGIPASDSQEQQEFLDTHN